MTNLQYVNVLVYSRTGLTMAERVLSIMKANDEIVLETRFGPVTFAGVFKLEVLPTTEIADAKIEVARVRGPESPMAPATPDGDRR